MFAPGLGPIGPVSRCASASTCINTSENRLQRVRGVANDRYLGRNASNDLVGVEIDADYCARERQRPTVVFQVCVRELAAHDEHDIGVFEFALDLNEQQSVLGAQRMLRRQDTFCIAGEHDGCVKRLGERDEL